MLSTEDNKNIEGSVLEFLDTQPWVLICNVRTITTRPLEDIDEEIQIRVQCFITSFSNLLSLSLCIYVHLESFSIPSSYLRNDCTLSNLPIVAEDDKIINELAGSWKFHIQFPSLTQSSCMTLAKSRNVSVTQFLICALTMRKNEAFLFISLKKHLYCHTCQVHPDPQHTY